MLFRSLLNVSRVGAPLWATAYSFDGFPNAANGALPVGVDIPASRCCMQETFAAYLVMGEPPVRAEELRVSYLRMLTDAAFALAKFPRYGAHWRKLYNYDVLGTSPPPTTQPLLFDTNTPSLPLADQTGEYGMDLQIAAIAKLKELGREKYLLQFDLAAVEEQLSATILGLEDRTFGAWNPEEVQALEKGERPLLSEQIRSTYRLLAMTRVGQH